MRLKEDSSSYRSSAIIKRDFKHDRSDIPIKTRSKKNTKKWCRGKVGVSHNKKEYKVTKFFMTNILEQRCSVCKKKFFTSYTDAQLQLKP